MNGFERILARAYRHIACLSWAALGSLLAAHAASSWAMLALSGEDKVAGIESFLYFYAVTATTVGYGDLSPATAPGRAATVLWIIPGGVALFTAAIAKLVTAISKRANARMAGLGDYSTMKGHLVVLGWQPGRTARLVDLFLADSRYDHDGIVLVDRCLDRNPMPESLRFVKADPLAGADAARRSGLMAAEVCVVVGADDNDILATALAVAATAEGTGVAGPRIVAHLRSEQVATLLRAHCPVAEVSVSLDVETVVRAAQDPGSSEVQRQILSPGDSPTQFSVEVPAHAPSIAYGLLFRALKDRHDATLIGVAAAGGRKVTVNARAHRGVGAGDLLYVVSDQRILPGEVDWAGIADESLTSHGEAA